MTVSFICFVLGQGIPHKDQNNLKVLHKKLDLFMFV